ncbi:MAG: alpha/beta fold hydrolase [Planctomycetota bacterium]
MNIHRWLDVVGQKSMWRYPRPPVESTREDALRLLAAAADELHPGVRAPEFEPRGESERKGAKEDRFTFTSPAPSGVREVDTVHCTRWRPAAPETQLPERSGRALVIVHGAYARDHAKPLMFLPPPAGASWDTVAMELPHHMRRQRPDSEYSGQLMVTADVPRLVRGMLQAESDIRALVAGLRREGYARIVLGGISLGGCAVLQAIISCPVEGAFTLVPSVDAYASLWETVLGECIAPVGRRAGFDDDLAHRMLDLITPLRIGRPCMATDRALFIYGRNDLLCPSGPVEALRRAWGGTQARVLESSHATLVLRYRTVRRIVAAWMAAVTGLGAR